MIPIVFVLEGIKPTEKSLHDDLLRKKLQLLLFELSCQKQGTRLLMGGETEMLRCWEWMCQSNRSRYTYCSVVSGKNATTSSSLNW